MLRSTGQVFPGRYVAELNLIMVCVRFICIGILPEILVPYPTYAMRIWVTFVANLYRICSRTLSEVDGTLRLTGLTMLSLGTFSQVHVMLDTLPAPFIDAQHCLESFKVCITYNISPTRKHNMPQLFLTETLEQSPGEESQNHQTRRMQPSMPHLHRWRSRCLSPTGYHRSRMSCHPEQARN